MSTPITNAQWRDYTTCAPTVMPRPTMRELDRLTVEERYEFNARRFAHLDETEPLLTPDLERLTREIRILAGFGATGNPVTARRGLAISGVSGLGKTTMAVHVARDHDQTQRARHSDDTDTNFQPSAYFRVPPSATPKALMVTIAESLGLVTRPRASTATITTAVINVLRDKKTSLVVIDEVHELTSNKHHGVEAASTMKQFAESIDATFIYAGVELQNTQIFTGELGKQLAARVKRLDLTPIGYGNQAQRDLWERLVLGMEQALPLAEHQDGDLAAHADYLHARTGGSIGSLKTLIHDAARAAIIDGNERITRATLTETLLDAAAETAYSNTQPAQPGRRRKAG